MGISKLNLKKTQEIIGKEFGSLTVLSFSHINHNHHSFFRCKCRCGKIYAVSRNQILKGQSCGCHKRRLAADKNIKSSKNMIGIKFGRWLVLNIDKERKNIGDFLKCRCECGTIRSVFKYTLLYRSNPSCGCYRKDLMLQASIKRIVGKKFGYWRATKLNGRKRGKLYYECTCECGNKGIINSASLLEKTTKSCGCKKNYFISKANSLHGKCGEKVYYTWNAMKSRCYNHKSQFYKYYGRKGIKVFKKWKDSFVEFYKYIGDPPSPKHSIDRIDHKKNYAPGNVRWATPTEQANNKSNNRRIIHKGKSLTLAELSRSTKINYGTLKSRLNQAMRQK